MTIYHVLCLLAGLFIGANLGLLAFALCNAAHDKREEPQ